MEKTCRTKLYKRPIKETYERGLQKRLINETDEKKNGTMKGTYGRNLTNKTVDATYERGLFKRSTSHKKDLLLKTAQ